MILKNPLTSKECLKLLDQAARHVDRAEHYWVEQQNLADAKAEIGNFSGIRSAIQEFGPKGGDLWRVVIALQHRVNALWKRLMHAEREGYGKGGVRHLPFPHLEGPPEDPADWWKKNEGKMIATQNKGSMQTEAVRAFLAGRKRSLGTGHRMAIGGGTGGYGTRYKTDGKTLWVWGNEVATRTRGAVRITDAGWLTLLTRNVLNEVLEQLGATTRIYSKRGMWRIWNYETKKEQVWHGGAVIKGGRVRPLTERGRPGIVFSGYTRRSRPGRYVPPPPQKPEARMLFNPPLKWDIKAGGDQFASYRDFTVQMGRRAHSGRYWWWIFRKGDNNPIDTGVADSSAAARAAAEKKLSRHVERTLFNPVEKWPRGKIITWIVDSPVRGRANWRWAVVDSRLNKELARGMAVSKKDAIERGRRSYEDLFQAQIGVKRLSSPSKGRMLFNPKVRLNLHLPVERAKASKLFRRVYGIAYRQLRRRDWLGTSRSYGILTGLAHAAGIERPPLTKLVRSWNAAISEIVRVAKGASSPDFWTRR